MYHVILTMQVLSKNMDPEEVLAYLSLAIETLLVNWHCSQVHNDVSSYIEAYIHLKNVFHKHVKGVRFCLKPPTVHEKVLAVLYVLQLYIWRFFSLHTNLHNANLSSTCNEHFKIQASWPYFKHYLMHT